MIGSRDQKLYAIETATGKVRWSAPTGGPLLNSPAITRKTPDGQPRVYIGNEDMRVYAFDLQHGEQLWRSEKLPGVSMRGYHPVIAPDGAVLVTVAPGIGVDRFQALLLDMLKMVFGDFASWRHKQEENARLREENFKLLERPETYRAQLDYLRQRLADQPAYQTFFVLDPVTGRERFVAPIIYSESMNGPGAPALVSPEGKVVVKYQALLRSRYEHYSPFLNVGYLDTTSGHITPIMDQSRTYGWHDSLLLVHDEQCQLSLAGRVLINTHQDNVNAIDLETLRGFPEPFCRNLHEPAKGEAVGIWNSLLRGQPLPVGKEWLARGTAVYGGGSVLDVGVSISGDSLYYLPTHEINAGVALIAYRMKLDGVASKISAPPAEKLTEEQWNKVKGLLWDWDTLEMPRLTHVLDGLPGPIPGTRRQPLTNEAAKAVAAITDAELDRILWEARLVKPRIASSTANPDIKARLAASVRELISTDWRHIESNWPNLRKLAEQAPNKMEEDCCNGYLAGLIACARVGRRLKDVETEQAAVTLARRALRERLAFEFAHTRGGLIWQVPKLRSVFSRWHFLSPEVGRFLGLYVGPLHRQLMDRYVDYHRPVWWLAWNSETMMRNECPYEFPTMSAEVFAARSLILSEPPERLAAFLDRPWCKGEEYYIQKLAFTLDAASLIDWIDLRTSGRAVFQN